MLLFLPASLKAEAPASEAGPAVRPQPRSLLNHQPKMNSDANIREITSSHPQKPPPAEEKDPEEIGVDESADEDDFAPDYALLMDSSSLHSIQTAGPAAGLEFTHKSRDFSNLFVAKGQRDFIPDSLEGKNLALEKSLYAQRQVLGEERVINTRTASLATWFPDLNLAYCHSVKGNHLRSMGKSIDGRLWLLPEECLFLIESGVLVCDCATVSSQEALREGGDSQSVPMSVQQAMECMLDFEAPLVPSTKVLSRRRISMDEYVVYGYLRRLGFFVIRHDMRELMPASTKIRKVVPGAALVPGVTQAVVKPTSTVQVVVSMFNRVFGFIRSFITPFQSIWAAWFSPKPAKSVVASPPKPLDVQPKADLSIQIPIAPIKVHHQEISPTANLGSQKAHLRVTYDVYRSSTHPTFRKTDPGQPDYHLAVVNVYSPPPCAADWNAIMSVFRQQVTSVKLAVVETASVSFFDVTSKEIISKGNLNPKQVKKKRTKHATKPAQ